MKTAPGLTGKPPFAPCSPGSGANCFLSSDAGGTSALRDRSKRGGFSFDIYQRVVLEGLTAQHKSDLRKVGCFLRRRKLCLP